MVPTPYPREAPARGERALWGEYDYEAMNSWHLRKYSTQVVSYTKRTFSSQMINVMVMMTTMIIATPYIVYHMLFKALVTLIQFNTYKNLTRE